MSETPIGTEVKIGGLQKKEDDAEKILRAIVTVWDGLHPQTNVYGWSAELITRAKALLERKGGV